VNDNQPHNHSLLEKDNALLVIIDMQERLVPAMSEKERLVENAIKLVKFSRIMGLPVLVTEQQKLGETIPEIRELIEDFSPITKLEFDCFGSRDFLDRINTLKKRALIIIGIEAHICVAQTALHALSDYRVHVVGDATSSRTPENQKTALFRMGQAGVTITSTEMVIYELLGRAGTDTFREVLKLVK